jgi:hypothetical protein
MHEARIHLGSGDDGATPLWAVLTLTALASFGTSVFWMGIPFIAKHAYGFSQEKNFLLAAVMGAIYAAGAIRSGAVVRALTRWISPRTVLALLILFQGTLCMGPVTFEAELVLWLVGVLVSITSAILWPLVESYLTSGRHGDAMRAAIGWFNLVWMTAVILPMLLIAPILEDHGRWAMGGQAVVFALALLPVGRFGRRPGHHEPSLAAAHVSREYPMLLRCARALLPMSYVLFAALTPILPYRYEELSLPVELETPTTALWMAIRVLAMVVMLCLGFWRGRWGALLLGGSAMAGGFALVVLAPTLPWMMAGFAVFGIGIGMIYYAALYYAMAVGGAAVDASGIHEALIGAGYGLGPLAALGGTLFAESLHVAPNAGMVGAVWAVLAVGVVFALRPYLAARAMRRLAAAS